MDGVCVNMLHSFTYLLIAPEIPVIYFHRQHATVPSVCLYPARHKLSSLFTFLLSFLSLYQSYSSRSLLNKRERCVKQAQNRPFEIKEIYRLERWLPDRVTRRIITSPIQVATTDQSFLAFAEF